MGSDSAVLPLVEALRDEYEEVRIAAAVSLGQLRSAAAVPGLIEALRDAHREVRRAAIKSLGQLPKDQRTAIEMHHLKGVPVAELARQMGRSGAAVTNLLYRGLKRLRELLGEAKES